MTDIASMFNAVSEAFDQRVAQEPYDNSLSPEEKLTESVFECMVKRGDEGVTISDLREHLRYYATYTFRFPNLATMEDHLEAVGFTVVREGRVSSVTI
jgi:hypothetical protein